MARIELTGLEGVADLERLERPRPESIADRNPEIATITTRLLLAHMSNTGNRFVNVMVLDRLGSEEVPPSKTDPLSPFQGEPEGALIIQDPSHSFKNP